ncbi:hypothetical protein ISS30_01120 [bacterium]|nr:hypothetical protein [bacterium]
MKFKLLMKVSSLRSQVALVSPRIQNRHSGTPKAYPESTVISIKYKQMVSTAESRHHTKYASAQSVNICVNLRF